MTHAWVWLRTVIPDYYNYKLLWVWELISYGYTYTLDDPFNQWLLTETPMGGAAMLACLSSGLSYYQSSTLGLDFELRLGTSCHCQLSWSWTWVELEWIKNGGAPQWDILSITLFEPFIRCLHLRRYISYGIYMSKRE